jgi:tol-pal system protein YbgF
MKLSKFYLPCFVITGILAPLSANAQTIPLHRKQTPPSAYQQQNSANYYQAPQYTDSNSNVQGQLQTVPAGSYSNGTSTNAPTGRVTGMSLPPTSGTNSSPVSQVRPTNQDVVTMQGIRIAQLEEIIRNLTGQLETLNHRIAEQSQQLAIMAKDVNFRFQNLETKAFGTPQQPPSTNMTKAPAPLAKPNSKPTSMPIPSAKSQPSPWAQAEMISPEKAQSTITINNPEQVQNNDRSLYNEAYALLRKGKHSVAETKLKQMLKEFPNSPLAGNAQYWLGETYYARGKFNQAASAFADGYKKYPSSTKGPDNLLKLGLTMKALGKKEEACIAFNAISDKFPDASNAIKKRTETEILSLECE